MIVRGNALLRLNRNVRGIGISVQTTLRVQFSTKIELAGLKKVPFGRLGQVDSSQQILN